MQVTSHGAETSREKAYLKVNSTAPKHKSHAKSDGASEKGDISKLHNEQGFKTNWLCLILPSISLDDVGMWTINMLAVENNN